MLSGGFFDGGFFDGPSSPQGASACDETSFFGGSFFCGNFFSDSAPMPDVDVAVKTGTGGIDGDGLRRRRIVKPTGLLRLPAKEGRKDVSDRVDESQAIAAEIAARLAREFGEENAALDARATATEMSMAEVEREIGVLLRKKLRTEEDEILLLLLMAAAAA